MTGPAWTFAVLAAAFLGLYLIACSERDRRADERDAARAERDDLDAVLRMLLAERPSAQVLPFGPVQSGVVRRVPGQRKGEGA